MTDAAVMYVNGNAVGSYGRTAALNLGQLARLVVRRKQERSFSVFDSRHGRYFPE
jgi:hypothetical protein